MRSRGSARAPCAVGVVAQVLAAAAARHPRLPGDAARYGDCVCEAGVCATTKTRRNCSQAPTVASWGRTNSG